MCRLKSSLRRLTAAMVAGCLGAFAGPGAIRAQEGYPAKPIEIIVPFAAGGSTDLGARVFAEALQARWNVPVRVINRPGGNTVPGVEEVMRSPPDGYTLLMDGPGSSSMLGTVVPNLPFDVEKRSFVGMAAQTPLMLVVAADSPWKTLQDAAQAIKNDPASVTWTSGAGTTDLTFRRFFQILGVDYRRTRPVQVRGGSEAITMTAGGHVQIGVGFWGTIAPVLAAGRLRVLAVAGPSRFPAAPDVPTTAEAGFPDLLILQWIGFSGPPGLPEQVLDAWKRALAEVARQPKVAESLRNIGLVPHPTTPEEMRRHVEAEGKIVRELWSN